MNAKDAVSGRRYVLRPAAFTVEIKSGDTVKSVTVDNPAVVAVATETFAVRDGQWCRLFLWENAVDPKAREAWATLDIQVEDATEGIESKITSASIRSAPSARRCE